MSKADGESTTSLRLGVPSLFAAGRFEQVLILTYNLEPEFYERVLRRSFGWFRNQIVLADAGKLNEAVETVRDAGAFRHLNHSWLATPIASRHAAHAKLVLLAGPENGLLLVGSGNLSLGGYARNGECFTPYRWTPDEPDDLNAFTAVRDAVDKLAQSDSLDSVAVERLRAFWHAYDWWNSQPSPDGPVRHNLDRPLGDQLLQVIGGEHVDRLTVVAPFHDPKNAALNRLIHDTAAASVRVLIQPGWCSVDAEGLRATLASVKGSAHLITAAEDPTAYLHAKIFLVETPTREICLTGSANCSVVALWSPQPAANLEIGNLSVGPPGTFQRLFDPAVVTISGPVDPTTANVKIDDYDPDRDEHVEPLLRLRELKWKRPLLVGDLSATVTESSLVAILLDAEEIEADVVFNDPVAGWTPFAVTVDDAAADRIESVCVVTVRLDGGRAASAIPYQVDRLREQDRRRVDVERLRHAAELEIDDPELNELLAALEGILIGDNVASWTKAPGVEAIAESGSDRPSLKWDEVDWDAVRRGGRHAAYGGKGGFGVEGSDLAAYLDALARATRTMLEPATRPEPDSGGRAEDDDSEGDMTGGVEGAESDDEDAEEESPTSTADRNSIKARNRRKLRNLIRRNIAALRRPDFREGAGPAVVILNLIILNHLCWWFSTSDPELPGELIDERLDLWTIMWGDGVKGGFFASVPAEYETDALEVFVRQNFEPVLLASIAEAWAWLETGSGGHRRLRRILRSAVVQPWWQAGTDEAFGAFRLGAGRPNATEFISPGYVAEVLWELVASPLDDRDVRQTVAASIGVDPNVTSLSKQRVTVSSGREESVFELKLKGVHLDGTSARLAIATWLGLEELAFYRLAWADGGAALYRAAEESGWIYNGTTEAFEEVGSIDPAFSPAAMWAERIVNQVVARATDAA